jgi:nucleotide-binding universal stress UspA family protein
MKKILFCTDLSPQSESAMKFAVEIAKSTHAEIIVLHSWSIPVPLGDPVAMPVPVDYVKMEAEEKNLVENICQLIRNEKYADSLHISCCPVSEMNSASSGAVEEANISDADLIVMGARHVPQLLQWLGTTASDVVHRTVKPVLIVPENTSFTGIERVVYATDLSNEPERLFDVISFAKIFHSYLYILHVKKPEWKDLEKEELSLFEERVRPDTDYREMEFITLSGKHYSAVISGFIRKTEADLLILFRNQYTFFEKLFHHSVSDEIIFKSEFPVLVFH